SSLVHLSLRAAAARPCGAARPAFKHYSTCTAVLPTFFAPRAGRRTGRSPTAGAPEERAACHRTLEETTGRRAVSAGCPWRRARDGLDLPCGTLTPPRLRQALAAAEPQ